MRRPHLAVGVSPWKRAVLSPEPRRRRQQSSLVFDLNKPGRAQRSLCPEGSPQKRCKMLKTNTFPADAQPPPGENCGLGICAAEGYRGFKVAYDPYKWFSICCKETLLPYYRQNIILVMKGCP